MGACSASKLCLGGEARHSFRKGVSLVKQGQEVCACLLSFLHDGVCCLGGIFNLASSLAIAR